MFISTGEDTPLISDPHQSSSSNFKTCANVFIVIVGAGNWDGVKGIWMVLPLEAESKDKAKFEKILGAGMGVISFMYATFGVLGYIAFGDGTKDIITTNLGRGLLSNLVQIGLCINLFFTFPLMMNPVYEVIERRFWEGTYSLCLRWVIVLVVSLVAVLVPNFADFLSLVGSRVCTVLWFVLPSLFHLIVFRDGISWPSWSFDIALIFFGVVSAVSGTWSSLFEIFGTKA